MAAPTPDHRLQQRRGWFPLGAASLASLAIAALLFGCGSDDGGDASPGELTKELVPPSELQFTSEREFEWDNETDFIVQGPYIPEGTAPSEVIDAISDAGFVAAAGANLTDENHEKGARFQVAAFDSEDGATQARDILHEEDLKQPCFASCSVSPEDYKVEEIPDSVAVHQVPNPGAPLPGQFKFEAYLLEFTIGSNLYLVQADGPPGAITSADFDGWAKAFYDHAAAQD